MKKWLISILAAGVALLASTAFADGSITLSPDGSTSTDASVRIDGQTVTITQEGTYKIAGTKRSRRFTVGVAGFEPTASSSRTKRATKLRHTPVPNEYSHTSSENPNRDRRTMGSVCHAAKMSVR